MRSTVHILAAIVAFAASCQAAQAEEFDSRSALETFIENAVLSGIPDPLGDVVNTVRAAPEIARVGLHLWLRSKMEQAIYADDMISLDRYQAFDTCLTQNVCDRLQAWQDSVTVQPQGDDQPRAGAGNACWSDGVQNTGMTGRNIADFPDVSLAECMSNCENHTGTPSCLSIDYSERDQYCYLNGANSDSIPAPGFTTSPTWHFTYYELC